MHRDFVFRHAMRQFLTDPRACVRPDHPALAALVYGWGSDWSGMPEFLAGCVEHSLTADGPILECGSGLSTLLIGAIAKMRGQRLWALEHSPEWSWRLQRYLDFYRLDSVCLCTNPLKDYGDFVWYYARLEAMPKSFAMVVCDGPPGGTRGGRYGLVPIMKDRLKPGCVICLDDAGREGEQAIARRWAAELGASFQMIGSEKPYLVMTLPQSAPEARLPAQAVGD